MSAIVGVLLAAGSSSRFGADKRLHPLADGTPMAVAAARNLLRALPRSVAVVRPDDRDLAGLLLTEGMEIVVNQRAPEGMGLSLACGVAATAEARGWVIALADMPFIRPATIRAVAGSLEGHAELAAPICGGRRGHPVGFGIVFRDHLLGLEGDVGARKLLARYADRLRCLEVDDPGILVDVDVRAEQT